MRAALNVFYRLGRGPFFAINAAVIIGATLICLLFCMSLVLPFLLQYVILFGVAYSVVVLAFGILILSNITRRVNDTRNLISVEAELLRSGYSLRTFFLDGAAANPSFQLFLLKCLAFCKPQRILELGSGQTTKVLAWYHYTNPSTYVLTLEQNKVWAEAFIPQITYANKTHDYRVCALEDRIVRHPSIARPIHTQWYNGVEDLATQQFDFILVDGPDHGGLGTTFDPYSRAGILEYIPGILTSSWVVVFDDAERYGECMTIRSFQAILKGQNVPFVRFDVFGEKTQTVLCSPSVRFLRSV